MGLLNFFQPSPPQEWVDLIFEPGTPAKRVNKKYLLIATKQAIENCNRIMADCQRIMKRTRNSDTFFSRMDLFSDQIDFLVKLEPFCKFDGQQPSVLKSQFLKAKGETVEQFIRIRYGELWEIVQSDATPKVKKNRIAKFEKMLSDYNRYIRDDDLRRYSVKVKKLFAEAEIV